MNTGTTLMTNSSIALLVEKGGDDLAAAHQPDVLAGLLAKTAHEWADDIVDELHA